MADNWGVQLWDQRPRIEQYTQENIDFTSSCREFAMTIAQVELEYSKQMRKVLKQFGNSMSADNTTCAQAWRQVLKSLEGVAEGHEQVAMKLGSGLAEPLGALAKNIAKERNEHLKEAAVRDAYLEQQMGILSKERGKYRKLQKDEEAALQAFDKAEKSETLAKAKIEKFRKTWEAKARNRETGKAALKTVTDDVNSKRTQYFHIDMPGVVSKIQSMDETRASALVGSFSQLAGMYAGLGAHQSKMAALVHEATSRHNAREDSKVFAQLHSSGRGLPDALPVEEVPSSQGPGVGGTTQARPQAHPQPVAEQQHAPEEEDTGAGDAGAQLPQIRIMYDFAGTNPGELPCQAGEVLSQLQNDGSGWVLSLKADGQTQGYVPASYIEVVS
eukprot:m.125358 g.125358  ORF g.125358 m.125358 type:complete len:387 (-) comp17324_c0_seq1:1528-2688(-)